MNPEHHHNPEPVKRWACVLTGFTQHAGTPSLLNTLAHDLENRYCGPGVRVRQLPWNHRWADFAAGVRRFSDRPKIAVVAYSWGAGWGLTKLAEALDDPDPGKRIAIDAAVLIDPVYRHPYPWGQWRAFLSFIPILIPRNVKEVWQFRQRTNWPRGHRLMADDEQATWIHDPVFVHGKRHDQMDDEPRVIAHARKICEGVLA